MIAYAFFRVYRSRSRIMFNENDCQSFKNPQNLNAVFHSAIRNLEHFTQQNASKTIPHVLNLEVRDSAIITRSSSFIKKIWTVTRYFFGSLISRRLRKKFEKRRSIVQEELLRSIATVKKHYLILDRFKEGSSDQQKFASLTHDVIERYNAIIQQSHQQPPSLREHLIKFVYDKMRVSLGGDLKRNSIELPSPVYVQSSSPQYHEKKFTQKLSCPNSAAASKRISDLTMGFHHRRKPSCHLTQHEMDAFCMKAITMIKNHAIPVTSVRETLNFVKTQPIVATVDVDQGVNNNSQTSIVSLSQTLSLFPGEVIELLGAFKRDSHSHILSTPITDRFQLSSKSVQSGFPHSSQHHGWALCDKLIPACPLRMDRLPQLQFLLNEKKRVALDLLPAGELIGKAKQILKLKKQGFDEQKRLFLSMHKALSRAIIRAAGNHENIPAERFRPVDTYFSLLVEEPAAFENFSKTIQLFNEHFIERPSNKLEEKWISGAEAEFNHPELQVRFIAAEKIVRQEIESVKEELVSRLGQLTSEFERATIEYIIAMSEVITPATTAIILQQHSEKIEYAPPMLNNFAQLIQVSLFKQVQEFHQEFSIELESDNSVNVSAIQEHLKRLLEEDLAHFKTVDIGNLSEENVSLVHELEDYYNHRFSVDIKPMATR